MYLSHFGLNEQPFNLTPDTGYFFPFGCHLEALNVLVVALRMGEGFVKVTGEIGSGKTMLCRKLLGSLDQNFEVAYIPNPSLSPDALLCALAEELQISASLDSGRHHMLKTIYGRLVELNRDGKKVVLCIDEAQTMADDSLECIRLLTNLETEKSKLLQIVLFGQPELDQKLNRTSLRQIKQRITFSYRLNAFDWKGINAYISYRLVKAGFHGKTIFLPNAIEALYRQSKGVPRLINILCHKAMLVAYGKGKSTIDARDVRNAARDTESVNNHQGYNLHRMVFGSFAVITLLSGITVSLDSNHLDFVVSFVNAMPFTGRPM
ncbi:MAG: ExeA family protein [Gammaproteobacteria bacterium]